MKHLGLLWGRAAPATYSWERREEKTIVSAGQRSLFVSLWKNLLSQYRSCHAGTLYLLHQQNPVLTTCYCTQYSEIPLKEFCAT